MHHVPSNLYDFYALTGGFTNQFTREKVTKLTDYQEEAWDDRQHSNYRLYIKSQKIGLSMLFLLEDLHIALTRGMSKEILIVSQDQAKARDHIQDLKQLLLGSVWAPLLMYRPRTEREAIQDQRTKTNTIYIRNPDDEDNPTVIAGLGITSPGQLISWKKVEHIHMSDITIAEMSEERFQESYTGLRSRLALTRGSMVIECPPRGPSGPIYEIVAADNRLRPDGVRVNVGRKRHITPSGYLVRRYTYQVGIDAGLFTPEFIEQERIANGIRFPMFYEGEFYSPDQAFFKPEHIENVSEQATMMMGAFR